MACIKRGVIVIFSVIKVRDSFINFAFNLFRLLIGADSVLYKMSAVLLYYNIVSLFKRKLVAMEIHVNIEIVNIEIANLPKMIIQCQQAISVKNLSNLDVISVQATPPSIKSM